MSDDEVGGNPQSKPAQAQASKADTIIGAFCDLCRTRARKADMINVSRKDRRVKLRCKLCTPGEKWVTTEKLNNEFKAHVNASVHGIYRLSPLALLRTMQ